MTSREDRYWNDGFSRACDIAEKGGVDALMAEKRMRGAMGMQMRLTSKELDVYSTEIKDLVFQTIRIAMIGCLHDTFGFGKTRIQKFMKTFDKFVDYLAAGWLTWSDVIGEIKERLNLDLEIENGSELYPHYARPESQDFYQETDFIDKVEWEAQLKQMKLSEVKHEMGTIVQDESGEPIIAYRDNYDKVRVYDFLCGMDYGRRFYGLTAPKTEGETNGDTKTEGSGPVVKSAGTNKRAKVRRRGRSHRKTRAS